MEKNNNCEVRQDLLSFIDKMIDKIKGTGYEKNWLKSRDVVSSPKTTPESFAKIEKALKKLEENYNQRVASMNPSPVQKPVETPVEKMNSAISKSNDKHKKLRKMRNAYFPIRPKMYQGLCTSYTRRFKKKQQTIEKRPTNTETKNNSLLSFSGAKENLELKNNDLTADHVPVEPNKSNKTKVNNETNDKTSRKQVKNSKTDNKTAVLNENKEKTNQVEKNKDEVSIFKQLTIVNSEPEKAEAFVKLKPKMLRKFRPPVPRRNREVMETAQMNFSPSIINGPTENVFSMIKVEPEMLVINDEETTKIHFQLAENVLCITETEPEIVDTSDFLLTTINELTQNVLYFTEDEPETVATSDFSSTVINEPAENVLYLTEIKPDIFAINDEERVEIDFSLKFINEPTQNVLYMTEIEPKTVATSDFSPMIVDEPTENVLNMTEIEPETVATSDFSPMIVNEPTQNVICMVEVEPEVKAMNDIEPSAAAMKKSTKNKEIPELSNISIKIEDDLIGDINVNNPVYYTLNLNSHSLELLPSEVFQIKKNVFPSVVNKLHQNNTETELRARKTFSSNRKESQKTLGKSEKTLIADSTKTPASGSSSTKRSYQKKKENVEVILRKSLRKKMNDEIEAKRKKLKFLEKQTKIKSNITTCRVENARNERKNQTSTREFKPTRLSNVSVTLKNQKDKIKTRKSKRIVACVSCKCGSNEERKLFKLKPTIEKLVRVKTEPSNLEKLETSTDTNFKKPKSIAHKQLKKVIESKAESSRELDKLKRIKKKLRFDEKSKETVELCTSKDTKMRLRLQSKVSYQEASESEASESEASEPEASRSEASRSEASESEASENRATNLRTKFNSKTEKETFNCQKLETFSDSIMLQKPNEAISDITDRDEMKKSFEELSEHEPLKVVKPVELNDILNDQILKIMNNESSESIQPTDLTESSDLEQKESNILKTLNETASYNEPLRSFVKKKSKSFEKLQESLNNAIESYDPKKNYEESVEPNSNQREKVLKLDETSYASAVSEDVSSEFDGQTFPHQQPQMSDDGSASNMFDGQISSQVQNLSNQTSFETPFHVPSNEVVETSTSLSLKHESNVDAHKEGSSSYVLYPVLILPPSTSDIVTIRNLQHITPCSNFSNRVLVFNQESLITENPTEILNNQVPTSTGFLKPSNRTENVISSVASKAPANKLRRLRIKKTALKIDNHEERDRLRPWLAETSNSGKDSKCISMMLHQKNLLRAYKCMGSDCKTCVHSFTQFSSHLNMHKKLGLVLSDDYKRCAYCKFKAVRSRHLLTHLKTVHKNDKYACTKCFYRCRAEANVTNHSKYYHNDKSNKFIVCDIVNHSTSSEALDEIFDSRDQHVLPITCPACQTNFYHFDEFSKHFKDIHSSIVFYGTCTKCSKQINLPEFNQHLKICFDIKKYQCAFCLKGLENLQEVLRHLMDHHPTKIMVCWKREKDTNVPATSIESVNLTLVNCDIQLSSSRVETIKE